MEIVIIEKKAFEDFLQTVEYFISRITSMDARTEDKQPEQWLDTADVCAGLQLDRRTVYSLREQGKLPFSQFQHRVYYKAKDVKALADGLAEKSPKSDMLGQDIITKDYFTDLYERIRKALELHEQATQHYRPLLDGVRYMTDKELSEMLKVSRHTLQQYRNKGLIPFTYCQGKVLYKEQDVQELLEKNYQPVRII